MRDPAPIRALWLAMKTMAVCVCGWILWVSTDRLAALEDHSADGAGLRPGTANLDVGEPEMAVAPEPEPNPAARQRSSQKIPFIFGFRASRFNPAAGFFSLAPIRQYHENGWSFDTILGLLDLEVGSGGWKIGARFLHVGGVYLPVFYQSAGLMLYIPEQPLPGLRMNRPAVGVAVHLGVLLVGFTAGCYVRADDVDWRPDPVLNLGWEIWI